MSLPWLAAAKALLLIDSAVEPFDGEKIVWDVSTNNQVIVWDNTGLNEVIVWGFVAA
jgi:hypothetical protein